MSAKGLEEQRAGEDTPSQDRDPSPHRREKSHKDVSSLMAHQIYEVLKSLSLGSSQPGMLRESVQEREVPHRPTPFS